MEGKAYLLANATYDQGQMTMVMVVLEVRFVEGKAYLVTNATHDQGQMTRSPSGHGCARGEFTLV